jgi:tripartite-type tricarboxylate transporter receptor subunit TctC
MKRLVAGLWLSVMPALVFSLTHGAFAQESWPDHPVRIIVPFAAGGSGDTLARIVAQHLSDSFKQQFSVENRPGGGGILGTQQFLSAPPDGYTIGMTNLSTLSLVPVINLNAGYDPDKDFTHIAYIGGSPVVLAANPQTGVKTLPEFISYANAPGHAFTFASSGVGSDGHLFGEAIAAEIKVRAEHVPYKATAAALLDVVAGQVPFSTLTLSSTASFLRAHSLNGVAVTTSERLSSFPDIPTFKELGYPELLGTTWFSLSGPLKLPPEIVAKINQGVRDAVAMPDVQERFQRDGFIAQPMSAAAFTAYVAAEDVRWKASIERAGLVGAEH